MRKSSCIHLYSLRNLIRTIALYPYRQALKSPSPGKRKTGAQTPNPPKPSSYRACHHTLRLLRLDVAPRSSLSCDLAPFTAVTPSVAGIGAAAVALDSVAVAGIALGALALALAAAAFRACDACRPPRLLLALSFCMARAYAV